MSSQSSSSTVQYHPLSLEYLWLKLVALLLRATVAWTYRSEIPNQRALIPAGVSVSRVNVPSRDKGRSIDVDVYSRETMGASGPRAVHLNFHGSGFVVPWLGSDTAFCARVAAEADVVVLDCDYRKAPEAPFPAAHNVTHDVFAYLLSQPTSFDPTRITASGFSAGASLALTLATTLPPSSLAGVISFYGNMTPSLPPPPAPSSSSSSSQAKDGMVITPSSRNFFYKSLLLPSVDPRDPRLNATVAKTERWPKEVLFVCGEADDLWRGAKELSERLEREGRKVGFVSVEGVAHGFDKKVKGMSGETRRKVDGAYGEAIELVRRCGRKE